MHVVLDRGFWRPMAAEDLAVLSEIGDRVHAEHPEGDAEFRARFDRYSRGCAAMELDGELVGYVTTHPWHYGKPPALNVMLGALPAEPTTYYIHDISLLPEARGTGAGSAIVKAVIAHARMLGIPNVSLIAVGQSAPFWRRMGFEAVSEPRLAAKLATYDAEALYMVRQL